LARSSPSVPSEDLLCLVMSRCERDLREECLRRRDKNSGFEEPRILSWLAQLCWGLQHLHARKFLHRDLKSQNVLLTQSGRVLLADFGVVGHLNHTTDFRRSIVGTPAFMSPEMLEGRPYGCETDQWALGCVLYEIMALEPPFAACESYAAVVAAVLHSPVHIKAPQGYGPVCYSLDLNTIVEALLARKPHERPSNTDLLRGTVLRAPFHCFLQSLEATAAGESKRAMSKALSETRAVVATPSEPGLGTSSLGSTMHALGYAADRGGIGSGSASGAAGAWATEDDYAPSTAELLRDVQDAPYDSCDFENYRYSPGEFSPAQQRSAQASPFDTVDWDASSASRLSPLAHALPGAMSSGHSEASSTEDVQEMSSNLLTNAGVGATEWRQLLAEAESLLQPSPPERLALEEVAHASHVRAALCDLLGTEEQVTRALGFLRERRPLGLGETVEAEADELCLQVEVLDLLGDEGLRALPLLEQLIALESRSPDSPLSISYPQ